MCHGHATVNSSFSFIGSIILGRIQHS